MCLWKASVSDSYNRHLCMCHRIFYTTRISAVFEALADTSLTGDNPQFNQENNDYFSQNASILSRER